MVYSGVGFTRSGKSPAKADAVVEPTRTAGQQFAYPASTKKELRRSRLDICYELMGAIHEKGEIGPTQLMYRANLSWKTFTELLEYLSERTLVRSSKVGARQILSLTELGDKCLRELESARRILVSEGPPGAVLRVLA